MYFSTATVAALAPLLLAAAPTSALHLEERASSLCNQQHYGASGFPWQSSSSPGAWCGKNKPSNNGPWKNIPYWDGGDAVRCSNKQQAGRYKVCSSGGNSRSGLPHGCNPPHKTQPQPTKGSGSPSSGSCSSSNPGSNSNSCVGQPWWYPYVGFCNPSSGSGSGSSTPGCSSSSSTSSSTSTKATTSSISTTANTLAVSPSASASASATGNGTAPATSPSSNATSASSSVVSSSSSSVASSVSTDPATSASSTTPVTSVSSTTTSSAAAVTTTASTDPYSDPICESTYQVQYLNYTIVAPNGYWMGQTVGAAAQDPSYLTYVLANTVDDCLAACDQIEGCVFSNTYYDVNDQEADLPKHTPGVLTCAMFSSCVPTSQNNNFGGQDDPNTIVSSNGYCKSGACGGGN